MLQTVLLWHLSTTALLLAAYLLVVGAQWSSTRRKGGGARRRAAVRTATVGTMASAALPGETAPAVAPSAA